MFKKRILALACTIAMIATVMSAFVVNAEAKAIISVASVEKVGTLATIQSNLDPADVPAYGQAGKFAYPLYKVTLAVSGLATVEWNSTWTACEGFIANGINTRVQFDDDLFERVKYVPASPLGGSVVAEYVEGSTDVITVAWGTTANKSAVSGTFCEFYLIPKTNADVTTETTFTILDEYTSILADYYDGTGSTPTISDDFVYPESGLVTTESYTLNKGVKPELDEPTVETDTKEVAGENNLVTKGYLVSAKATTETKAINGITITASANGVDKEVPYTFTTVKDGTVKVAVNVLNVPAGNTVDFSYVLSTVAE